MRKEITIKKKVASNQAECGSVPPSRGKFELAWAIIMSACLK